MAIQLEVVSGPDTGRSFRVEVGSYRVIGRAYGMGGTAMISQGERRRLDAEDQRVARQHLQTRAPGRAGAREDVDDFVRADDIDLSDDAVSQNHAMVFVDEAGVSIVDLGSTNGSTINGKKLAERSDLTAGDLLRLGATRIEVKA